MSTHLPRTIDTVLKMAVELGKFLRISGNVISGNEEREVNCPECFGNFGPPDQQPRGLEDTRPSYISPLVL